MGCRSCQVQGARRFFVEPGRTLDVTGMVGAGAGSDADLVLVAEILAIGLTDPKKMWANVGPGPVLTGYGAPLGAILLAKWYGLSWLGALGFGVLAVPVTLLGMAWWYTRGPGMSSKAMHGAGWNTPKAPTDDFEE